MTRLLLLFGAILLSTLSFAQNTKANTAKIDFKKSPTIPVEGVKTLGIQVYTADMPFNKDTLRFYLNNLDMMMSDAEQAGKIKSESLEEFSIVGGEGDVTVNMALGMPLVVAKELKTSSCMGRKSECTQYYYKVKYYLPAVVQIRKAGKLYGTWDLNPELDLKFGNDQTETQYESAEGTTTSIKVTEYRSEADLEIAFNSPDNGSLARQAILKQISEMADVIYEQVFFNDSKLKLDIAYGAGKAADYTETVTAAENAVTALEGKQYEALTNPIAIWENWLAKHDATNKKAAVNNKVAKGLHENLAIAYAFQGNYPKATEHITQALELANTGNKNLNEINRLTKFQQFIAEKEQAELNNANVDVSALKTAPNIKKLLGKRKLNAEIDFLFAEDKYQEMKDNQ